jgi:hypothetical protein
MIFGDSNGGVRLPTVPVRVHCADVSNEIRPLECRRVRGSRAVLRLTKDRLCLTT